MRVYSNFPLYCAFLANKRKLHSPKKTKKKPKTKKEKKKQREKEKEKEKEGTGGCLSVGLFLLVELLIKLWAQFNVLRPNTLHNGLFSGALSVA